MASKTDNIDLEIDSSFRKFKKQGEIKIINSHQNKLEN